MDFKAMLIIIRLVWSCTARFGSRGRSKKTRLVWKKRCGSRGQGYLSLHMHFWRSFVVHNSCTESLGGCQWSVNSISRQLMQNVCVFRTWSESEKWLEIWKEINSWPNMEILSLFICPHVVPNPYTLKKIKVLNCHWWFHEEHSCNLSIAQKLLYSGQRFF